MIKKVLLYLLISILIFSNIAPCYAQGENIVAENDTILSVLGATLPYEYDENRPITKAEFVYLVMKAANDEIKLNNNALVFSDVKLDFWAHDAILSARVLEYVLGHGDGTFGIEDKVSVATAATIAMRVLGFKNIDGDYTRNFSSVYSNLIRGVGQSDEITIKQAMMIIENMLDSSFVIISAIGEEQASYEMVNDETFMEYKHDVSKNTGIVNGTPFAVLGEANSQPDTGKIVIDNIRYQLSYDVSIAQDYIGYEVTYYVKEEKGINTVIFLEPTESSEITHITSRNLLSVERSGTTVDICYENSLGKEKHIKFPITCDFIYNGKTQNFQMSFIEKLLDNFDGEIKIVESNDTCLVSVKAYTIITVLDKSEELGFIYGKNGEAISVKFNEEDGCKGIFKNGESILLSGINKGDVLQVLENDNNAYEIIVLDYKITGTVEMYAAGESVTIDGATYDLSNYFNTQVLKNKNLFLGMNTSFFFNEYGQVVDFDDDNIVRDGEYLYFVTANELEGAKPKYAITAVRLNAAMIEYELNENVRVNDNTTMTDEELYKVLMPNGVAKRGLIFAKVNEEGKIKQLHFEGSEKVQLDATEALRKNKNSRWFLGGSSEAFFPEIYVGSKTVFLQVPSTTSSDDVFEEKKNYKVVKSGDLVQNQNYNISAYNFNDYNVAEIILIQESIDPATALDNADLMVVKGFGSVVDADGNYYNVINGFVAGTYKKVKYESDSAITYKVNGVSKKIKAGDVVALGYDNAGFAFTCKYIKNINNDFNAVTAPEGKQEGDAFIVGNVISNDGTYIRIALKDSEMVCASRSDVKHYVTIYNSAQDVCQQGKISDILPGSPVLIHLYYSTVKGVIVKQ